MGCAFARAGSHLRLGKTTRSVTSVVLEEGTRDLPLGPKWQLGRPTETPSPGVPASRDPPEGAR